MYGDYDGPDKPNKGHEGGACNRTRCQSEPALYFNHGSYSWYCEDCKIAIGEDPVNKRGWDRDWLPRLGHAQFETREERQVRVQVEYDADVLAMEKRHVSPEYVLGGIPEKAEYGGDLRPKPKTHPVSIFGNRRHQRR